MIGCHYPLGEPNGALVLGAGDERWAVWLSMFGYTCEWTTVFLNVRWWLSHTLRAHSWKFACVSALLIASYFARMALLPYLVLGQLVPRYEQYNARRQIFTFGFGVFGHVAVLALSIQWFRYLGPTASRPA